MELALFGAGCFWGVQYYFDHVPGVVETMVGYTGGHTENPRYEEVCTGTTGHAEVVRVKFDPRVVTYKTLVKHFLRLHDPTQLNRQGPDVGEQYRSAIFYYNDSQRDVAQAVLATAQAEYDQKIVTELKPKTMFYVAEGYHQKFTEKTGRGECSIPYASLTEE